jgi:NAD(P)-dependent dehydrogenase (short-subunit alcohol dehydrogenase family)
MNNSQSQNRIFHGKRCLVTGGTRGIGYAIARMLLLNGADVAICGRSQASLDQALAQLRADLASENPDGNIPNKVVGKPADVKEIQEVQDLFGFVDREFAVSGTQGSGTHASLDVLVNNAGVGKFGKISELSLEDWQATIGTNLTGAFLCSKEALYRFGKETGGYIVNISSLAGKNPFAGGSAYNASKFGMNGFSEAMMLDTRYDHVRVSSVMPGSVATDFTGSGSPLGLPAPGSEWKIWPEDVARIVKMLLEMPSRTLVSAVEVRPSQPKRNG